jgi:hypothetical protein
MWRHMLEVERKGLRGEAKVELVVAVSLTAVTGRSVLQTLPAVVLVRTLQL